MNEQIKRHFAIQNRRRILQVTLPMPQIRDENIRKAIHFLQIQIAAEAENHE